MKAPCRKRQAAKAAYFVPEAKRTKKQQRRAEQYKPIKKAK